MGDRAPEHGTIQNYSIILSIFKLSDPTIQRDCPSMALAGRSVRGQASMWERGMRGQRGATEDDVLAFITSPQCCGRHRAAPCGVFAGSPAERMGTSLDRKLATPWCAARLPRAWEGFAFGTAEGMEVGAEHEAIPLAHRVGK